MPRLCGPREDGPVRVLVVEDERILADAIAEWLRREAFAVDLAYDGDAALERLGIERVRRGRARPGPAAGARRRRLPGGRRLRRATPGSSC